MINQAVVPNASSDVSAHAFPLRVRNTENEMRVVEAMLGQLQKRGYRELRSITCEFHEGMLILRGGVSTYFLKQIAQEIGNRIPEVRMVVNAIEVIRHSNFETFIRAGHTLL